MRPRDSILRLKRFQADERRRQVAQIEATIADFEKMAADLDRQIAAEQDRTGIKDANHFAYSTFARAARQRRQNLVVSIEGLRSQLEGAKAALSFAMEDLAKLELLAGRSDDVDRGVEVEMRQGAKTLSHANP